jgi:hypothetical protein
MGLELADKVEALPLWRSLDFGLCPASSYPNGQKMDELALGPTATATIRKIETG